MNGYRELAAMLEALSEWIEDALAAGQPPRWVAYQASTAVAYIALLTRITASGEVPR